MIFIVFSAFFFKPYFRNKIDPMPLKTNDNNAGMLRLVPEILPRIIRQTICDVTVEICLS
jgi:hypothetical protein